MKERQRKSWVETIEAEGIAMVTPDGVCIMAMRIRVVAYQAILDVSISPTSGIASLDDAQINRIVREFYTVDGIDHGSLESVMATAILEADDGYSLSPMTERMLDQVSAEAHAHLRGRLVDIVI